MSSLWIYFSGLGHSEECLCDKREGFLLAWAIMGSCFPEISVHKFHKENRLRIFNSKSCLSVVGSPLTTLLTHWLTNSMSFLLFSINLAKGEAFASSHQAFAILTHTLSQLWLVVK